MIEVFLDTNVIISEGFLQSALAEAILNNPKFLDITILIPQVVIDESKRNLALQLQKKITKYKESRKDLNRFTDLPDIPTNLDDVIDKYNVCLDDILNANEIIILPYPKVPMETIIAASYEAKKPFNSNGKGFKDYAIWQTIKNYCESNPNSVERVFITNDTDFIKDQGNNIFTLHPDLVDSLGSIKEIPELVLSLENFFDLKLQPSLKDLDAKDIPKFDIYKKVETILEKELLDYSPAGFEGLPFDPDIYISCAEDVVVTKAPQIYKLEKDNILIKSRGTVCITVEGSMDKMDYEYATEKGIDIDIESSDMRDYHVLVSKYITTPFKLDILYSTKDKKILNHTITLPDEVYHDSYG